MTQRKPAAEKKARKPAPPPVPKPHRVRVVLDANGLGKIMVDGRDWSGRLLGVEVFTRGGRGSVVKLVLAPVALDVAVEAAAVEATTPDQTL